MEINRLRKGETALVQRDEIIGEIRVARLTSHI